MKEGGVALWEKASDRYKNEIVLKDYLFLFIIFFAYTTKITSKTYTENMLDELMNFDSFFTVKEKERESVTKKNVD